MTQKRAITSAIACGLTACACMILATVMFSSSSPAQAKALSPVDAAIETAKAVASVRKPVVLRTEAIAARLEDAKETADRLAVAATNPAELQAVVRNLTADAAYFREFADDEASLRNIVGGSIETIQLLSDQFEERAAEVYAVQARLEAEAEAESVPEAKAGKLAAARIAGVRAKLWLGLAKANTTVQAHLRRIEAQVERIAAVAGANADLFEQVALTAGLAADMQDTARILRNSAGAEVEELIDQMQATWKSLETMVGQMQSDAEKLTAISVDAD